MNKCISSAVVSPSIFTHCSAPLSLFSSLCVVCAMRWNRDNVSFNFYVFRKYWLCPSDDVDDGCWWGRRRKHACKNFLKFLVLHRSIMWKSLKFMIFDMLQSKMWRIFFSLVSWGFFSYSNLIRDGFPLSINSFTIIDEEIKWVKRKRKLENKYYYLTIDSFEK